MDNRILIHTLSPVLAKAKTISLERGQKYVIFSDLHMGNGSSRDDFAHNAGFFSCVLEHHYLPANYRLILNGDIEELQKFRLAAIMKEWAGIYELFNAFNRQNRLLKTVGNHDLSLYFDQHKCAYPYDLHDCIHLDYRGNSLYIFHGYQAKNSFMKYYHISGFLLRYLAKPLGIKNYSVSRSNHKKYQIEQRLYHFSRSRKFISIIGHTHRPLFESFSKIDHLRFEIEQICRHYPALPAKKQLKKKQQLKILSAELQAYQKRKNQYSLRSMLYNDSVLIPCLFNSGCAVGKRGMTCLEILDGKIALVYWFDEKRDNRPRERMAVPRRLKNTDYYSLELNQDQLDYIFTRIKLLA